jgi:hypothetical protein
MLFFAAYRVHFIMKLLLEIDEFTLRLVFKVYDDVFALYEELVGLG